MHVPHAQSYLVHSFYGFRDVPARANRCLQPIKTYHMVREAALNIDEGPGNLDRIHKYRSLLLLRDMFGGSQTTGKRKQFGIFNEI